MPIGCGISVDVTLFASNNSCNPLTAAMSSRSSPDNSSNASRIDCPKWGISASRASNVGSCSWRVSKAIVEASRAIWCGSGRMPSVPLWPSLPLTPSRPSRPSRPGVPGVPLFPVFPVSPFGIVAINALFCS